eukprot:365424-Chlamydomonas_euryale.AAC.16
MALPSRPNSRRCVRGALEERAAEGERTAGFALFRCFAEGEVGWAPLLVYPPLPPVMNYEGGG